LIRLRSHGSFSKTDAFLKRMKAGVEFPVLEKYGPIGVAALTAATPVESGATQEGWYYEITKRNGYFAIHWYNSNVEDGIPIAILIQYGHGTRNGGYVQGTDYINPAMRTIFESMASDMWKEVTK
jgi:hypothetical protein